MVDPTLPLPGLSSIEGKAVVAHFDGGRLSSDGGLLVLREIERRLNVAERLAACIDDPRDPGSTLHTVADIIRFRLLMIAAGYEDGNDAVGLRTDNLNQASQAAIERLGAQKDGVLRHHGLRRDGTVRDTVMYSILRSEWPAIRMRLHERLQYHATGRAGIGSA